MRQIDYTEEIINNVQYKEALLAPLKHNVPSEKGTVDDGRAFMATLANTMSSKCWGTNLFRGVIFVYNLILPAPS